MKKPYTVGSPPREIIPPNWKRWGRFVLAAGDKEVMWEWDGAGQ